MDKVPTTPAVLTRPGGRDLSPTDWFFDVIIMNAYVGGSRTQTGNYLVTPNIIGTSREMSTSGRSRRAKVNKQAPFSIPALRSTPSFAHIPN